MYTFVHATKTGGTAVEQYFKEHHPTSVAGTGHLHKCGRAPMPIIIVRDPEDRFVSMFNYWRNGAESGKYVRDPSWSPPCRTISDFIALFKQQDPALVKKKLCTGYTTKLHFVEQSYWIEPQDYSRTIVIAYDKNGMDDKIRKLLLHVGLPPVGLPLPKVNVTKRSPPEALVLSDDDRAWIRSEFKNDFRLWHLANKHPDRFKLVV